MIALLGLGLLAVLLLVGRREWRRLRRETAYRRRVEERGERISEDVCWRVYRHAEAELAIALWRREWPAQMAGAVNSMSEAFRAFSVPVKEASARLARLNALFASDPDRRV